MTVTPDPPVPFFAHSEVLPAGSLVYRCHDLGFRPGEPNPGPRGPGRFHFFGSPPVPALYFAQTMTGALCERLLRYTPAGAPTRLAHKDYGSAAISGLVTVRDLKMAKFHSEGLRALDVQPNQLTDTDSSNYPQTRKWAEAAYEAGFDGISWMSHQLNGCASWMVFGDRVPETEFSLGDVSALGAGPGFAWLVDTCATMNVDVIPPAAP